MCLLTDQDGDAICVESEESLQVALSYVKPDAAGFNVVRLTAKFSQDGCVKLSNTTKGKPETVVYRGSTSVSPKKKPNGYSRKVKKGQLNSHEPSSAPQRLVNRAGFSKVAVEVTEEAMDEPRDESGNLNT